MRALALFVLELAKIHDSANRGLGVGGNLNQVQPDFACSGQGVSRRHDTELIAGIVDDANRSNSNLFVDSVLIFRILFRRNNFVPFKCKYENRMTDGVLSFTGPDSWPIHSTNNPLNTQLISQEQLVLARRTGNVPPSTK